MNDTTVYPMVPLKKITERVLLDLGACSDRHNFTRVFPDGATPTFKIADEHYDDWNWGWAAGYLLNPEGKELYSERNDALTREFRKIDSDAYTQWRDRDYEKYREIADKARKQVRHSQARLFVELFRKYPILVRDRSKLDPNAGLDRLRNLITTVEDYAVYDNWATLTEMAALVKDLDQLMSKGRRKPTAWTRRRSVPEPVSESAIEPVVRNEPDLSPMMQQGAAA
jgi:hypothetical protein